MRAINVLKAFQLIEKVDTRITLSRSMNLIEEKASENQVKDQKSRAKYCDHLVCLKE